MLAAGQALTKGPGPKIAADAFSAGNHTTRRKVEVGRSHSRFACKTCPSRQSIDI